MSDTNKTHPRRAIGTIIPVIMMLSVASMLGVVGLSFYNSKMVPIQQLVSFSLANDTNKLDEKLMIENAVYHSNTQSFNVTLTNVGYIPISITQLQIQGQTVVFGSNQSGSSSTFSSNSPTIDNTVTNTNSGGRHGSSTMTVTLSTSNTNDVIMIIVGNCDSGKSVNFITDSAGLTYHRRTTYNNIGNGDDVEVWYAISSNKLSSDQITVKMTSKPGWPWGVVAYGVSGANTNSPFDGSDTTASSDPTGNGNNPSSLATVSRSANAGDLLIGALVEDQNSQAPTAYSGMTMIGSALYSGGGGGAGDSESISTSGTYTIGFNLAQADSWGVIATAIQPAQSSGGAQASQSSVQPNCLILPGQSCTISTTYHCFTDPVSISVTTGRGNTMSTTAVPNDPWYSSQWQFRKSITINYARVSSTLYNFTALVSITDQNLKASAQSNGNDILFTSCDKMTKLNHEIEGYASSTGTLTAWVKIPALYNSSSDIIYMYYGNSVSGNQQNPQGSWDSNYTGVWHMNQVPTNPNPSMKDSTSNQNHLSASNFVLTDQIPGQINGSLSFGGNSRYLSNTSPPNNMPLVQGQQTGSVWFKITSNPSGVYDIYTLEDGHGAGVQVGFRDSSHMNIWKYGGSALVTISLPTVNQWHYAVYTWDGTTHRLYIDGQLAGTSTGSPENSQTTSFYVGTYDCGGCENYVGQLDEIRYSNIARSAAWISTEYNNQAYQSSFITVGPQQGYLDPRAVK